MIGLWRMTGIEGISPEGWLPDRVSVGAVTKAFPPELVDRIVEATDTREVRRRLLPARLVVYFVLALWLFRGRPAPEAPDLASSNEQSSPASCSDKQQPSSRHGFDPVDEVLDRCTLAHHAMRTGLDRGGRVGLIPPAGHATTRSRRKDG